MGFFINSLLKHSKQNPVKNKYAVDVKLPENKRMKILLLGLVMAGVTGRKLIILYFIL